MNTLARILSHGFAIVVVVILALGLIYRGELFPDMQMPGFLALDKRPVSGEETSQESSGTETAPGTEPSREEAGIRPVEEEEVPAPVVTAEMPPAEPASEQEAGTRYENEQAAVQQQGEQIPVTQGSAEEPQQEESLTVTETPPAEISQPATGAQAEMAESVSAGEESAGAGAATVTSPDQAIEPGGASPPAEAATTSSMTTATEQPIPAEGEPEGGAATEPPAGEATGEMAPTGAPDVVGEMVPAEEAIAVPAETTIPAAEQEPVTPYQLLAAAREAYWMHDYARAESNYLRLAEQEPDNPDSYGELGNMYFSQGKWEQAAAAFFEAGKRLVDGGHIDEAQSLVNVIRGLNGTQADKLEKLIAVAGGSGNQQ